MENFNLLASNIIDLELKLDGKLPVDRDELLALVNSWERYQWFYTRDKNNKEIKIEKSKANEKYDLSKLDVSKIINFDDVFSFSNFDGNINSWDVSKVTSINFMFYGTNFFNSPLNKWNTSNINFMLCAFFCTKKFNQDLNNWDISNVKNMINIFSYANSFNQPLLWDLSKVESCNGMFSMTKSFENRFNNKKELPYGTNEIKKWLKDNQELMIAMDIEYSKGTELDNFLLNLNVIDSANLNGLHNIITSTKLNGLHNDENNNKIGLEYE